MDKLTEYKRMGVPDNTVTRNVDALCKDTKNIYETAVIVAKRADEITAELKSELSEKLDAFMYFNDAPDREVFENEEQIEVSRSYEHLPKPTLLAMEEFLAGKLSYSEEEEPMPEVEVLGLEGGIL